MHCRRDIRGWTLIDESKMVYFMGFLQAEIMSQECGGNLLAVSGWDQIFSQQKSSFLASQFHFWAVSTSKVFGMHTNLYWLRCMRCRWRHMVNIVRRDGTLMNLTKCKERDWLEETDWYWTTVSCSLSVSGQQVDDWHLPLKNAWTVSKVIILWLTNYAL